MNQHFLLTFNGIMPIVCLIGFGYFLKRIRFLSVQDFKKIDRLCYVFFIPVMLFYNIYSADLASVLNWNVIIFMVVSLFAVFALSMLAAPLITKNDPGKATVVHGLGHGNLAVVGFPLITTMFGASETALYSIMVACSSPFVNGFMVYEHTYYDRLRLDIFGLFKRIITSPYLAGTLIGLFCNLIGLRLPLFMETAVQNVRSIASPLSLISMGGSFYFSGFGKYRKEIIVTCIGKCIIVPAIILPVAALLGFHGVGMLALTVIFTCPSAVATYSFSVAMCGDPDMASQIVVYSTILSIFTIFLWVFSFLQLGLF